MQDVLCFHTKMSTPPFPSQHISHFANYLTRVANFQGCLGMRFNASLGNFIEIHVKSMRVGNSNLTDIICVCTELRSGHGEKNKYIEAKFYELVPMFF